MKIVTEIVIGIEPEKAPDLFSQARNKSILVSDMHLEEENSGICRYSLTVSCEKKKSLDEFLGALEVKDICTIHSIRNASEELITGGLLRVTAKAPLENRHDLETFLLGGFELQQNRLIEGNGYSFSGISSSVGIIDVASLPFTPDLLAVQLRHASCERDAVVLSRFGGLNPWPLLMFYEQREDLMRQLSRLEQGFSALRLQRLGGISLDDYEEILSGISIPLLSREFDEIPLLDLARVLWLTGHHSLEREELTVGLFGLEPGTVRLTSLLRKTGIKRVLGYDEDEHAMLGFEHAGGMATTIGNIFSNADILIFNILPDEWEVSDNLRPGQAVIVHDSKRDLSEAASRNPGILGMVLTSEESHFTLFPGILLGMVRGGYVLMDDRMIIHCAEQYMERMTGYCKGPDIFSDIHTRMADIIMRGV